MTNIKLGDVRYNARMGAFEARVDVLRDSTTYRYPCQIAGPMDMSCDAVAAGLAAHAIRMSDSGTALRSVI